MRILHIIQRFYPARGGAESHLAEISRHLSSSGHSVTVATTDALDFELLWEPGRRRFTERSDVYKGVKILRFPVRHVPASRISYPAIRRLLLYMSKSRMFPSSVMMEIARLTPLVPELWRWASESEVDYDVVAGMTIGIESVAAAGLAYARRIGIPYICYPLTHLGAGATPGEDPVSRFYTMRHQVALVRSSNAVIAQTESEKSFYEKKGVDSQRIGVIGPGVDPQSVLGGNGQHFASKHEIVDPLVLYIGYLSRDKGAFHTVEAVNLLKRRNIKVELALIGTISTEFRHFFDALAQRDRERVHLLGPLDDSEKRDALDAAAMLVMPSRTDSFGLTYLEAWLYNKPVIAANTWGVTDLVEDGKDGLIVPFGDANALADAIERLLNRREEADQMGAMGKEKVYRSHTWEKKLHQITEIYEELVR